MRGADTFSEYHPLVSFVYFVLVFAFSMVLMHPVCLAISLISAIWYSVYLGGRQTIRFQIRIVLPMMLLAAVLNPAFSHEGATVLTYLPSGNPLTLESILYGLAAAAMLAAVVCWFSCFNRVITSDKFVWLFGRIIPSLSLVLSMTLRFVPRFRAQAHAVADAQRCVGRDVSSGSLWARTRCAVTILSILITWSLENAVETADSMRSRGYGLPGRTAFSIYRFGRRDKAMLAVLAAIGGYLLYGALCGGLYWRYYPTVRGSLSGLFTVSLFIVYLALCTLPMMLNRAADRRWKRLYKKLPEEAKSNADGAYAA